MAPAGADAKGSHAERFQNEALPKGLTTGAGMWLAGAVGVAFGMAQYGLMAVTVIFALILLRVVKRLKPETDFVKKSDD